MNPILPPERDLPRLRDHRRRLLATMRVEPRRRVSGPLVPAATAASMALVLVGGAYAFGALPFGSHGDRIDDRIAAARAEDHGRTLPGGLSAWRTRPISGKDRARFYDACLAKTQDDERSSYKGFRPLYSFAFLDPPAAADPAAVLIAGRGRAEAPEDLAICTRGTGTGPHAVGGLLRLDLIAGGQAYLRSIVDGQSGRYVYPVATVTVEDRATGVERKAYTWRGMWFWPQVLEVAHGRVDDPSYQATIGFLDHDYRYRGYDRIGRLVFDSDRDGPWIDDCFVRPDGSIENASKAPIIGGAACRPTYAWKPPAR